MSIRKQAYIFVDDRPGYLALDWVKEVELLRATEEGDRIFVENVVKNEIIYRWIRGGLRGRTDRRA